MKNRAASCSLLKATQKLKKRQNLPDVLLNQEPLTKSPIGCADKGGASFVCARNCVGGNIYLSFQKNYDALLIDNGINFAVRIRVMRGE